MGGIRFPLLNLDYLQLDAYFGNRLFRRRPMEVLPRTTPNTRYVVLPAMRTAQPRSFLPPKIGTDSSKKSNVMSKCKQPSRPPLARVSPSRSKLIRQGTYSVLEPKVVKGPSKGIEQGQRENIAKGLHADAHWKSKSSPAAAAALHKNKAKAPRVPPVRNGFGSEKSKHHQTGQSFWIDL